MITRLQIKNFKSLHDVDLKLGKFNIFVGANASGKSNLFEAFKVLEGVGNGFTWDEILNGRPKGPLADSWDGIRGGSRFSSFRSLANPKKYSEVPSSFQLTASDASVYTVSFAIRNGEACLDQERLLTHNRGVVFTTSRKGSGFNYTVPLNNSGDRKTIEATRQGAQLKSLTEHADVPLPIRHTLIGLLLQISDSLSLDLSPAVLREYSSRTSVVRIGSRGEDFPALVDRIIKNVKFKDQYVTWLKKLMPENIQDVVIEHGAIQEKMFSLKIGGTTYPAPVLSDGTLRFAALTAAFFQDPLPRIMTIEEIENGIHASRLWLLMELLRTQSSENCQVFATTHSPLALAWLTREEYDHAFYCWRNPETGETRITPFSQFSKFLELMDKGQSIIDLFGEGWFEVEPEARK